MRFKNILDWKEKVRNGEIDLEKFYFKLIDKLKEIDEKFSCLNQINTFAIEDARKIKENLKNSKNSKDDKFSLDGYPISVKDNICAKGLIATAGSKILSNYLCLFDATVIERLKEKKAIIIGKTSMDEFGFGTFGVNTFKIAKNAINPNLVPGGSSSGSAVLTKLINHASIAESTGGSISCPSCFNSVFGLTPTYGLVSRYGLIDYANSLDKIGVIARNTIDIAFILSIIAGKDFKDSTCIGEKKDYISNIEFYNEENISNVKIAIPKELVVGEEKVVKRFHEFVDKLKDYSITIEEVSMSSIKYAIASYYIIACCEASTNLAKYCGLRYGIEGDVEGKSFSQYFAEVRSKYFGEEAKRRILLGTFARSKGYKGKYYMKALVARQKIIEEFKSIFRNFDFILTPTMPILPKTFEEVKELKPIEIYNIDILTVPPNLAGVPMINIPIGKFIGIHLITNHFEEIKLLQFSRFIEKSFKIDVERWK